MFCCPRQRCFPARIETGPSCLPSSLSIDCQDGLLLYQCSSNIPSYHSPNIKNHAVVSLIQNKCTYWVIVAVVVATAHNALETPSVDLSSKRGIAPVSVIIGLSKKIRIVLDMNSYSGKEDRDERTMLFNIQIRESTSTLTGNRAE